MGGSVCSGQSGPGEALLLHAAESVVKYMPNRERPAALALARERKKDELVFVARGTESKGRGALVSQHCSTIVQQNFARGPSEMLQAAFSKLFAIAQIMRNRPNQSEIDSIGEPLRSARAVALLTSIF